MILAVASLVILLVVQPSFSAVQSTCTTRSDCASDECCYHANLLNIIRKRQVLPFNLAGGTCHRLAKVGQACDFLHACGCEAGSSCMPDNMNHLMGGAIIKRQLLTGFSAHCHRNMNV